MAHHVGDYRVLHPARDEDGDSALWHIWVVARGCRLLRCTAKALQETRENWNKIVDAAKEQNRGKASKQGRQNRRSSAVRRRTEQPGKQVREVSHYLIQIVADPEAKSRKILRDLRSRSHFLTVTDLRFTFVSFSQLVQELISGAVRRHTFTPSELELLLDLQNSRIRKSSRPDVLRRYLRAAQLQLAQQGSLLRLSKFMERENQGKAIPHPPPVFASPVAPAPLS